MAEMIRDFMKFVTTRKKWWLLPLVLGLLAAGLLIFAAAEGSPLAPFIYTLF